MEKCRIALIGAGNVATHLAVALSVENDIVQIFSRHLQHAESLAESIPGAEAIDSLDEVSADVDFCIIAVKDDAIAAVAAGLPEIKGVVAHTSGSVGIDALKASHSRYGVFYPLQTFSIDTKVDIAEVPFFIEGIDETTTLNLCDLASKLSQHVYIADSQQRALLHIAAVFGCNFFNHMLHISTELLSMGGYDLSVLAPLLRETLRKALDHGAYDSQTGPAVRGDRNVMSRHIATLPPQWAQIYRLLSQDIYDSHNSNIEPLNI